MFAVFSSIKSWFLVWTFLSLFCQYDSIGGDGRAGQKKSDAYYGEIKPEQFVEREDLQATIDPRHFDAPLLSAAIFHCTNMVRSQYELKPLKYNSRVARAAQKHAEAMAVRGSLFHGAPSRKSELTPYERLRNEGLRPLFSAENIAFKFMLRYKSGRPVFERVENGETVYSYEPGGSPLKPHTFSGFARGIVQQWMDSPFHRENVLTREASQLGVGCALSRVQNGPRRIYCDQDFFTPFPSEVSGSNQ